MPRRPPLVTLLSSSTLEVYFAVIGAGVTRRTLTLTICFLLFAGIGLEAAGRQAPVPDHRACLNQYCFTCHNQRAKTAGLALDTMDLSAIGRDADTWEKVVRKLRSGMMPPQGSSRPDDATRGSLVSWLTTELDRAAAAN